jgi:hypothetical protein
MQSTPAKEKPKKKAAGAAAFFQFGEPQIRALPCCAW